jgi:glutathione-regulated potassium-efflux system ancillary protein KefG
MNAVKGMKGVTFRNMYDLYPDFNLDIQEEQAVLLQHDIIVWHHPFYWYSSPSLLKEWIDLVLVHGFAYGKTGKALEGKSVMSAISTGGSREAYGAEDRVKYSVRQLLAPFEQTVELCRMNYLPPFVTHGTHLLKVDEIEKSGEHYALVIQALVDGTNEPEALLKGVYMNDLIP